MNRIARRRFLAGAASVLCTPFLDYLPYGTGAVAKAADGEKFFVYWFHPTAVLAEIFFPAEGALSAATLPRALKSLSPFVDKLVVYDGLDMHSVHKNPLITEGNLANGHNAMGHVLFGGSVYNTQDPNLGQYDSPGGRTLDYVLADVLSVGKKPLAYQVGASTLNYSPAHCALSSTGRGRSEVKFAQQNPWAAYVDLFGTVSATDAINASNASDAAKEAELIKRLASDRSALDLIISDLTWVKSQVPADARPDLEAHLEGFRDIETQMKNFVPGGASSLVMCELPKLGPEESVNWRDPDAPAGQLHSHIPEVTRLQTDILVTALGCGIMNVGSFQLLNGSPAGFGGYEFIFDWIDGVTMRHHHIDHLIDPDGRAGPVDVREQGCRVDEWQVQQFANLIDKMSKKRHGDGTLLDKSIVLFCTNMGDSASHLNDRLTWMTVGNLGGAFKAGRCIRRPNTAHNELHVALLNAYGIPTKRFGDADYGREGGLKELFES